MRVLPFEHYRRIGLWVRAFPFEPHSVCDCRPPNLRDSFVSAPCAAFPDRPYSHSCLACRRRAPFRLEILLLTASFVDRTLHTVRTGGRVGTTTRRRVGSQAALFNLVRGVRLQLPRPLVLCLFSPITSINV